MKRLLFAALALLAWVSACKRRDSTLPAAYADVGVPQQQLRSLEALERGRALFGEHCALCHGASGDGHGTRREGLSSRPRDLTDSAWRSQATERGVYFVIREGVRGTAMPSWKSLEEAEAWDLVAFVLSVGQEPRR